MAFQSTINVELGFGVPGALYDDGPVRAGAFKLSSESEAYNVVGATAFTLETANPGTGAASAVASAGGTAQFVGILMNPKVYATAGVSGDALSPTMTLPNETIAELLTMGTIIVTIPGPASPGDLVCYDLTTGKLGTYPKTTAFTGALSTDGVLTVSAVSAGQIQVGQQIAATGVPGGIYISAVGTGLGFTGTYTTNYVGAAVTARAMTAASLPPAAAAFTGALSTGGVLTVSAVASGEIAVGQVIYGTNVSANTVITGRTSGVGGTGTYTTNYTGLAVVAEAMTADATAQVPNAQVVQFSPAGNGVGVISLTN